MTVDNQHHQSSSSSPLKSLGRTRKMLVDWGRQNSRHGANLIVSLSEAIFGNQSSKHTSPAYLLTHYLLRLIILILCLVGCFFQIGTIVHMYFSYPAIVFVDIHPMEKLLLPAFTICNENRFATWTILLSFNWKSFPLATCFSLVFLVSLWINFVYFFLLFSVLFFKRKE